MVKSQEFLAFLNLFQTVTTSPALKHPEKIAAIEEAFLEYSARVQPSAFRAIAKRLASEPLKVHDDSNPTPVHVAPAPAPSGTPKRPVVSRSGR